MAKVISLTDKLASIQAAQAQLDAELASVSPEEKAEEAAKVDAAIAELQGQLSQLEEMRQNLKGEMAGVARKIEAMSAAKVALTKVGQGAAVGGMAPVS